MWLNPIDNLETFMLKGISYRSDEAKAQIPNLQEGVICSFQCEPNNPVDPDAVKILYKNHHIGYVESKYAHWIAYVSRLKVCYCQIFKRIQGEDFEYPGLVMTFFNKGYMHEYDNCTDPKPTIERDFTVFDGVDVVNDDPDTYMIHKQALEVTSKHLGWYPHDVDPNIVTKHNQVINDVVYMVRLGEITSMDDLKAYYHKKIMHGVQMRDVLKRRIVRYLEVKEIG